MPKSPNSRYEVDPLLNGQHKPPDAPPTESLGGIARAWLKSNELNRPDEVEIGAGVEYTDDPRDETASWEDVAKVVDGIKWLLKGWVPYGMLSGIIAEPKAGKSAWVLWNLVRPLITAEVWFTGQRPFAEPRDVLWIDTEGSIGLNLERMKQWGLPLPRVKVPFPDDPFRRIDLNDSGHVQRIGDVICKYKTPLVVVDSYRGSHGKDENSSLSGSALSNLADIVQRTHAAAHVIHHTGKLAAGTEINANSARQQRLPGDGALLARHRPPRPAERLAPCPGSRREFRWRPDAGWVPHHRQGTGVRAGS